MCFLNASEFVLCSSMIVLGILNTHFKNRIVGCFITTTTATTTTTTTTSSSSSSSCSSVVVVAVVFVLVIAVTLTVI